MDPSAQDNVTDGYTTLNYDLLIGCDGEHSIVRKMFHEYQSRSSKNLFTYRECNRLAMAKTITVSTPRNTELAFMTFLNCMPNVTAFIFPSDIGDDELHLTFGYKCDQPCDDILLTSDDPNAIAEYFAGHFSPFCMDWAEVGQTWVEQPWFETGMMFCSKFH